MPPRSVTDVKTQDIPAIGDSLIMRSACQFIWDSMGDLKVAIISGATAPQTRRASFIVVLGGCLALAASIVAGAARAQAAETAFDIPSQPMASALIEFGEQANSQLVATGIDFSGVRSGGVTGDRQLEDALRELLSGSGFTYSLSDDNTIVIKRPKDAPGKQSYIGPKPAKVRMAQVGGNNTSPYVAAYSYL